MAIALQIVTLSFALSKGFGYAARIMVREAIEEKNIELAKTYA